MWIKSEESHGSFTAFSQPSGACSYLEFYNEAFKREVKRLHAQYELSLSYLILLL